MEIVKTIKFTVFDLEKQVEMESHIVTYNDLQQNYNYPNDDMYYHPDKINEINYKNCIEQYDKYKIKFSSNVCIKKYDLIIFGYEILNTNYIKQKILEIMSKYPEFTNISINIETASRQIMGYILNDKTSYWNDFKCILLQMYNDDKV